MNNTLPIIINPANTLHLMVDVGASYCLEPSIMPPNLRELHQDFAKQQEQYQHQIISDYNIKSLNVQFGKKLLSADDNIEQRKGAYLWDAHKFTIEPYPQAGKITEANLTGKVRFNPDLAFEAQSPLWFIKEAKSAFCGPEGYRTALPNFLQTYNYNNLIITGLYLDLCCKATWQDAVRQGFNVILPYDQLFDGKKSPTHTDVNKNYLESVYKNLLLDQQARTTICHSSQLRFA